MVEELNGMRPTSFEMKAKYSDYVEMALAGFLSFTNKPDKKGNYTY